MQIVKSKYHDNKKGLFLIPPFLLFLILNISGQSNTPKDSTHNNFLQDSISEVQIGMDRNEKVSTTNITIAEFTASNVSGENDPLLSLKNLPGISSPGNFKPDLFIQGSSSDKNLFLLDEATIYQPFHQLGIFSIIDGDILRSVEVQKGYFDSQFDGRLSAVIQCKTTNEIPDSTKHKISIGLLSSKYLINTPLSQKSSLLLSLRGSYFSLYSPHITQTDHSITFVDGVIKFTLKPDHKTKISFLSLGGYDQFQFVYDQDKSYVNTNSYWMNQINSFNFTKVLKTNILKIDLVNSNYHLSNINKDQIIDADSVTWNQMQNHTRISEFKIKATLKNKKFLFGTEISSKKLTTESEILSGTEANNSSTNAQPILLSAFGTYNISYKKFEVQAGIRCNLYHNESSHSIINPRLQVTYKMDRINNLHLSAGQNSQYLYVIGSNSTGIPIDSWLASNSILKPQIVQSYNVGYQHKGDVLKLSLNGYLKKIGNEVNLLPGSSPSPFVNIANQGLIFENIENRAIFGTGENLGIETFISLKLKKHLLTLSYTYSRSTSNFNSTGLRSIKSKTDVPHQINISEKVKISDKWNLSISWIFKSGQLITLPTSVVSLQGGYFPNSEILKFDQINNYRLSDFHKLDVNATYRVQKKHHVFTGSFGVYNLYNRKNTDYLIASQDHYNSISLGPITPNIFLQWTW